jgi:CheY-like chemotaxis protein
MVLDLKMPRLDGVSLLDALPKPPPVVIVSATDMNDEARQRVGSKVVTHLSKPVPPQRLLDAVAHAVRMDRPS